METNNNQIKYILLSISVGIWGLFIQNLGIFKKISTQNVNVVNSIEAEVINPLKVSVTNSVDANITNTVRVNGSVDVNSLGNNRTIDVNIAEVGGWKCWSTVPVEISR